MTTVLCIICRKSYSVKGIHTHFDRTHGDLSTRSKYSSGNNGKYDIVSEKIKHNAKLKREEKQAIQRKIYDANKPKCKCGNIIPYEKFGNLCCSIKCANSRGPLSSSIKEKISSSIKEKISAAPTKPKLPKKCSNCKGEYYGKKISKFCSIRCSNMFKTQPESKNLSNYRKLCKFRFNIFDYEDEFDLELIREFGLYKPSNRGNNLEGVSRDHMVSVKFGFINDIDPNIISHPANCQLMKHSANVSKNSKCSISIDDLMSRIEAWVVKYGT